MIKEVSIVKAFDDYREAMDYTKTILEDVVLLTVHGENGKKLHGPISKVNIQEILNLFKKKEWQGLTDDEIIDAANMAPFETMVSAEDYIYIIARAIEAKLKEKNSG
jgi:hypothetical protein